MKEYVEYINKCCDCPGYQLGFCTELNKILIFRNGENAMNNIYHNCCLDDVESDILHSLYVLKNKYNT